MRDGKAKAGVPPLGLQEIVMAINAAAKANGLDIDRVNVLISSVCDCGCGARIVTINNERFEFVVKVAGYTELLLQLTAGMFHCQRRDAAMAGHASEARH